MRNKLLTLALGLSLSGCGNSSQVNDSDIKNIEKILNVNGNSVVLSSQPIVERNYYGGAVGSKGTNLFLEFPDGTRKLIFKSPLLIYEIEVGNLNQDSISDFIISGYPLIQSGVFTNSFKASPVSQRYLGSMDGDTLSYSQSSRHR